MIITTVIILTSKTTTEEEQIFSFYHQVKRKKHQAAPIEAHENKLSLSFLCPSSESSASQGHSITCSSPPCGIQRPMVWTRCCDDKTLLAAIREQREQSSISLSSNLRSSIDFPRMRNGRQEKAQSDMPMGPVSLCVCLWENQQGTNWCQTRCWDQDEYISNP